MRAPLRIAILAAMVAVAAMFATNCGQLNPEYCTKNPDDPDCLQAGLGGIDAPQACGSDSCKNDVDRPACDLNTGTCVECTSVSPCPMARPNCINGVCHGCLNDTQCGSDMLCAGSNEMCVAGSTVAYVTPTGSGTACSAAAPCTLDTALAQSQFAVIRLVDAQGAYATAGATITRPLTIAGPPTMGRLQQTQVPQINVGSGLTIGGSNLAVSLQYLAITAAQGDAITCSGAGDSLSLDHAFVTGAGKRGVVSQGCTLVVEHSQLHDNKNDAAIDAASSTVTIVNDFVYNNGGGQPYGAIHLTGTTSGYVRFDTVINNKAGGGAPGGIACALSGGTGVVAHDDLVAGNSGTQIPAPGAGQCDFGTANYIGSVDNANFQPGAAPYLSATSPVEGAPTQGKGKGGDTILDPYAVVDVSHTVCVGDPSLPDVPDDIDGEVRPHKVQNNFCDRGADEYVPTPPP